MFLLQPPPPGYTAVPRKLLRAVVLLAVAGYAGVRLLVLGDRLPEPWEPMSPAAVTAEVLAFMLLDALAGVALLAVVAHTIDERLRPAWYFLVDDIIKGYVDTIKFYGYIYWRTVPSGYRSLFVKKYLKDGGK